MSDLKNQEKKRHKEGKAKNERDIRKKLVLHEIQELGGEPEDYDLIAGIDSDEDEPVVTAVKVKKDKSAKQMSKTDQNLAKDLKSLAKELGLRTGKYLEQITVDDDYQSNASEPEISEQEHATAKVTTKKENKAKKVAPVKPNEDLDDFKIHPKKVEPPSNGGHSKGQPIFESVSLWHEIELEPLHGIPEDRPAQFIINRQFEQAKALLAVENEYYSTSAHVKSSDRQFLSTIMRSGTLNDRVSALTLVVQESPLHATKSMDALMTMCKKKGRNEAVSAVGAVKDLMQGSVLPARKLKYFADQEAVGARDVTDHHLIVWAFEDYLKRFYFALLGVIETLSMDPLPFPRNHMVRYIFELLKDKAEQEANLLRLLANKLGDKDKKIASKCSHFCLQLMQTHPMMINIIIRELEQILFKPTISQSAQYYVIITLNQTILSQKNTEAANHLINVYFTFFTKLINESETAKTAAPVDIGGKKNRKAVKKEKLAEQTETAAEEMSSKMISAVLTGVNRAFPFSNLEDNVIEQNIDTLYKITHSSNFNTSIQALILLHQVSVAKEATADRFYRTLYESISDPRLLTSSKQALYLNLLFKSLKSDKKPERTKAFVKRLVQSATMHSPAFICALFFLFSELEMAVPAIRQLAKEVRKDNLQVKSEEETVEDSEEAGVKSATYDGRARDPRFANAQDTNLWEIMPFLHHYHPSVCLFAKSWLTRQQMPSKPDLGLHTLTHFLDRFVYRNAKTKANTHGGSIMQPLPGGDTRGMIMQQTTANQQPVNTESFYKQNIANVAADEIFFYKYFTEKSSRQPQKASAKQLRKNAAAKAGSDDDGDSLEDGDGGRGGGMDEDEVWRALVNSRPEVEAPSDVDEDDDLDLDDLEAAMSDSDSGSEADADAIANAERNGETGGCDLESLVSDDEDIDAPLGVPVFKDSDFETGEPGLDFDEGEDDLIPLAEDSDPESDSDAADEFTGFDAPTTATKKRKNNDDDDGDVDGNEEAQQKKKTIKKKKKVKLPAFASADEYMHIIEQS